MPAPYSTSDLQPTSIWTLEQGLLTDKQPTDIPPQAASETNNVIFYKGYLRPRDGVDETLPTGQAFPVYHVSRFHEQPSGEFQIHGILNTGSGRVDLYYWTGTWNSITPGGLTTSGFDGIRPGSTEWKFNWWFCPGDGEMVYWDGGASVAEVQSLSSENRFKVPADPRFVGNDASRLFVANVVDRDTSQRVPYRIAWCDVLNAGLWNGGYGAGSSGYVDLADDSDPITGLYCSSDLLLVFKPTSTYIGRFVGPPKFFEFRQLPRGTGCVAQGTIKDYRDGIVVWLGDDNVYAAVPGQLPKQIGNAIEERIKSVVQLSTISRSCAVVDRPRRLYHLFMPNSTNGKVNKIFTCNLENFSWWEGQFANPNIDVMDAFEYRINFWNYNILLGSRDGKIYKMSEAYTNDDGTSFSTSYTSGVLSYERLSQGKTQQAELQLMRVHAPAGQAALSVYYGNGLDRFQELAFGTQICDGTQDLYVTNKITAEHFKFRITELTPTTRIAGVGLGFMLDGDTRRRR